jgi:hypothetical protein
VCVCVCARVCVHVLFLLFFIFNQSVGMLNGPCSLFLALGLILFSVQCKALFIYPRHFAIFLLCVLCIMSCGWQWTTENDKSVCDL